MPYFDLLKGYALYRDDVCDHCSHFPCAGVYSDLVLEGASSQWNEIHIHNTPSEPLPPNTVVCRGYDPYISPAEKQDPDPDFGRKISQQLANRWDGLPENTPRPLK